MKLKLLFILTYLTLIISSDLFSQVISNKITFAITQPNGIAELHQINSDGTNMQQLTIQNQKFYGPEYSPDGSQIVFYNHINDFTWSLYKMDWDGRNIERLTNLQNTLDWSPDWSLNGEKIVFARSYTSPTWRSEIWVMNPDGSNIKRIGSVEGQSPDWSTDGSKITYFNYVDGGGDIWVMDADGSNVVQLTNDPSEDWNPKWSPRGNEIVFQSKRDGNFEIYVMNIDGSNVRRLTNNTYVDEDPNWSPDGTKIVFISMRDGHYEIYVMNSDGTDQTRITNITGHAIDPVWIPVEITNVEDKKKDELIQTFELYQNYPNPFNPTTTIRYNLTQSSNIILKIYSTLGHEIRTLVNEYQTVGNKAVLWDGTDNSGKPVSSGVYIYRIQANGQIISGQSRKMLVLK